jgi:hypothetical protein
MDRRMISRTRHVLTAAALAWMAGSCTDVPVAPVVEEDRVRGPLFWEYVLVDEWRYFASAEFYDLDREVTCQERASEVRVTEAEDGRMLVAFTYSVFGVCGGNEGLFYVDLWTGGPVLDPESRVPVGLVEIDPEDFTIDPALRTATLDTELPVVDGESGTNGTVHLRVEWQRWHIDGRWHPNWDASLVEIDSPTMPYLTPLGPEARTRLHAFATDTVTDLEVVSTTPSTATIRWTQVDDGTGAPAWYRVKYDSRAGEPWNAGDVGCEPTLRGGEIGAEMRCTVEDLEAGTHYNFQLMSFRSYEGIWVGSVRSNVAAATTESAGSTTGVSEPAPTVVDDLEVTEATSSTLTVRWTQVDDGRGEPAWYRLRYGSPLVEWKDGAIGCDRTIAGTDIGAQMTCTVEGLEPDTSYELQLYSYHWEDGRWAGARASNRASGATDP